MEALEANGSQPTPSATNGVANDAFSVGHDIRALRKSRSVTLSDMAKALDRSIGWLSQVERGQTEPGIPDLRNIAQMFEIPVSFFFRNDMAKDHERGTIVRAAARASLGSHTDGLVEQLLSPHLSGDFEMIRSEFQPHCQSDWVKARPTQEGGYVVSGSLTLSVGEDTFVLEPGDSFQFEDKPYRWANETDQPTIVIWVISPPVY